MLSISDEKVIRMIPAPRAAAANGVTASAKTYGTGTAETCARGIVDTAGWDVAVIEVRKSSGSAAKASWRIGEQSAAATLYASATNLASAVQCGITTSRAAYRYVIDLRNGSRKRYLNAIVVTSTTCGMTDITCRLQRGETYPPTTTGFVSTTVIP